jgi:hypothetical protein
MVKDNGRQVAVGEFASLSLKGVPQAGYVINFARPRALDNRVLVCVMNLREVVEASIEDLTWINPHTIHSGLIGFEVNLRRFGTGVVVSERYISNELFPHGMLHVCAKGTCDASRCSDRKGNVDQLSEDTPISEVMILQATHQR